MNKWIDQYIELLVSKIVSRYDVAKEVALSAVNDCGIRELCQDCPEYVTHEDPDYFVTQIYEQRIKPPKWSINI